MTIQTALNDANGRATAHSITYPARVRQIARDATARLDAAGVTKAARKGAVAVYQPEGSGKAYARKGRYIVTTRITLTHTRDGWRLTEVRRVEAFADSKGVDVVRVSQEARAQILYHAMRGFDVLA